MDFSENEEHLMIRELVRDFAETTLTPTIEHRDETQTAPLEEWQEFVELARAHGPGGDRRSQRGWSQRPDP